MKNSKLVVIAVITFDTSANMWSSTFMISLLRMQNKERNKSCSSRNSWNTCKSCSNVICPPVLIRTRNREDELMDDQSELTYLKLKLEALETQVVPYLPSKESNKLTQRLRRWKLDWADVENRFRLRRRKRQPEKDRTNNSGSAEAVTKDERFDISQDQ